jgi:large subunit ribosomal protein L7/L12
MANMNVEQMVEELSTWSVMDVAGLVKALEEKWGVSAAPAAVAVGAAGGAAADAAPEEEQTEFTVELVEVGAKKINVIKAIREITSAGLADAKNLVEAAPKVVKEDVSKEEAEEIKKKLEEAGAKVSVK